MYTAIKTMWHHEMKGKIHLVCNISKESLVIHTQLIGFSFAKDSYLILTIKQTSWHYILARPTVQSAHLNEPLQLSATVFELLD